MSTVTGLACTEGVLLLDWFNYCCYCEERNTD